MAVDKYKDLNKRTQSEKLLRDKAFEIANDPKYDGYQRGMVSMVYKFFHENSASLSDLSAESSGIKSMPINKSQKNFINQLLENSKEEECILRLKTKSDVLI